MGILSGRFFGLVLALVSLQALVAAETTAPLEVAAPTDNSSSATVWTQKDWGTLGIAKLQSAPYPDDSRTTGYRSKNGVFPYAGHYDDPTVAIAIPSHYQRRQRVDLVVHFHGWSNEAALAIGNYHIGEQLTSSGKNAIVLLPQGPKNSKDSSIGKLQKPSGFANLLNDAVALLVREGKLDQGTTIGNVVVSGHSGGYFPIAKCISIGGVQDNVKEAWLWDASYGEHSSYVDFAVSDPRHVLRSLFTDHLMPENVRIIGLINRRKQCVPLFEEDDLTTAGSKGSKGGPDEIDALLSGERLFFMHTHLAHNRVMDEFGYFEKFARFSPFLEPVR
jgi:hypothetical protein